MKQQEWSIKWANNIPFEQRLSAHAVLVLIDDFPTILKDDKRSLVKQGNLLNNNVVAKQPRDKNRRKWSRFHSWFRPAEAMKSFRNLEAFSNCGIPAAKSIAVLERKRYGQVLDSWLIYEFLEGEASSHTDLPTIIQLLNKLHKQGFQHNDPHYKNFLKHPNGKLSLIDCIGKKRLGSLTDCHDFLLLNSYHPEATPELIKQYADFPTQSVGYKLACFYIGYKRLRTRLKQFKKR